MKFWLWKLRVNVLAWRYRLPWGVASWDDAGARDAFEAGDSPDDYIQEAFGRE